MFVPFFHHHCKTLDQQNIADLPMLLKQYYPDQSYQSADSINQLHTAWLMRDLHKALPSSKTNPLSCLQNPQLRRDLLGLCPTGLADYLHIYNQLAEDKIFWQQVPFSSEHEQAIERLKKTYPLLQQQPIVDLSWRLDMGLLCSAIIEQHCQQRGLLDKTQSLWAYSMDYAILAMWQAEHVSSHRLRAWLSALLQGVALIVMQKQLQQHGYNGDEHQLLSDIQFYQYRLAYWIGKDWGMPEDLLFSLRQRFMKDKPFTDNTLILQRAQHLSFIRDLRQQQQFSKRHALQMLLSFQSDSITENAEQLL